ncbi:YciI family protein [Brachybacterium huguangmaarense]|uniref:YciI family protein n=1 Tax=Brachybacterium huguangmaarense TaxID=1652028 RepID=A0ABY6G2N9_9MICO|nr:YciI family protein [Brachybacterium huguangmaarense]UYG17478.1 YciI family protein [Brachybacterium huguangmaarense]
MTTFAIQYVYGEDAASRDQHRSEHRAFLRTLLDQGTVLLSGPYGGDGAAGALIIAQGESAEAVLAVFDDDPFRREGLVAERSIRPWDIVIGELPGLA